jgi:uncharacterized repeat protein (TIGR01451 family)
MIVRIPNLSLWAAVASLAVNPLSTAIAAVPTSPPVNTAVPSISGTPKSGLTLVADPGTWTGSPAPTFTYQWRRCDAVGDNCADIGGATSSMYSATPADAGFTVRVVVTGSNGDGDVQATSNHVGPVTRAPSMTVQPSISGTVVAGDMLTASPGTWNGYPSPTYAYQWRQCDPSLGTCTNIGGAVASTYVVAVGDIGSTIRVAVTASNSAGSSFASSNQTVVVTGAPPVNTVLPAISGAATVGQQLTASPGTWTGAPAPTYSYQWQQCDGTGANCADIGSATSSTYTVVSGDNGQTIRVVVTGTNALANASATSAQTSTITPPLAAPVNTAPPTISGTTQVGDVLTGTAGTFTAYPASTSTYAWLRCDASGNNCSSIGGATGTTYTLTNAELGSTIVFRETATNSQGSAAASSAATAVVVLPPAPPANSVAPSVSGTAESGQLLTASSGTWTGNPSPTLSYQWRRCDANGANCADIGGETNITYTLVSGDVGGTIRVVVTGTNGSGASAATSVETAVVVPPPLAPSNSSLPTISGTMSVGQLLTSAPGTWSAFPAPAFTYQWQRCDAAGASCFALPGATSSTYPLAPGDQLHTVRVAVTGTNATGTATAVSAPTAATPPLPPPSVAPTNTAAPSVSGTPRVGEVLSAQPGTWSGTPTPTITYQWQRCDTSSCANVSGATNTTYTLASADLGASMRVVVTATNGAGAATATASASGPVLAGKVEATQSKVYTLPADSVVGNASADSVPADGSRFARVRIELRDGAGNPVAGRAADVVIAVDTGVTTSPVRETSTSGVYEFDLRSTMVTVGTASVSIDGVTLHDRAKISFVKAVVDLDIKLSANNETPQIGDTVVFTVEVRNLGPNAATGVEVEHKLADRVAYVSSEATRGQYDPAAGTWKVGGLALGESVVLKVTVKVTK